MKLEIREHALIITHNGLSVSAEDKIGEHYLFNGRTATENRNGKTYITCEAAEGIRVVYSFCEKENQVEIGTWFEAQMPVVDTGMRWMRLNIPEDAYRTVHGTGPEFTLKMEDCVRPIAFNGTLNLIGTHTLGFSGGSRPTFDPDTRTVSLFPELARCTGDLRVFDSAHPLVGAIWFDAEAVENTLKSNEETDITPCILTDALSALHVKENGISINKQPLFLLSIKNTKSGEKQLLTSERDWDKVKKIQREGCIRLTTETPAGLSGIAVTMEATYDEKKITWRGFTHIDRDDYSLEWMSYPRLVLDGLYSCVLPSHSGEYYTDWNIKNQSYSSIYPNGFGATMSFMSFIHNNAGIYVGIHDRRGCTKSYNVTASNGRITTDIRAYAENMGHAGNSYSLPGEMVWESFEGGWYEVAMLYREFIITTHWYPKDEKRIPRWMKDVPFWIMDWMPNTNPDADPIPISVRPEKPSEDPDAWVKNAIKLKEALGTDIGYHVYNWHWIPFNNDFPHYFPVKEGFIEGVKRLEAAGIHVMPYINALLWDTRDCRGEDVHFTQDALPACAKDENGHPITSSYASHEPDGTLCKLAHMCPTTSVWREKVRENVRRLFEECGVSAVYLDQISAHRSELCMDGTHPHLPGGGSYWNEGYERLIDGLRIAMPDDGALTSESNAEVYARALDGFLTWAWVMPHLIPVFQSVYGGTVAMFGRNTNGYKKRDAAYQRYHYMESLLTGQQLGWSNADVVNHSGVLPFLKKCVEIRMKYKDMFSAQRPMKPPVIEGEIPYHTCITGMNCAEVSRLPLVDAARWENVILIANASDKTVKITIDNIPYTLQPLSITTEER